MKTTILLRRENQWKLFQRKNIAEETFSNETNIL